MAKKLFLTLFFIVSTLLLVSCETTTQSDLEVLVATADGLELEVEVTDNFVLPVTFENEDITVTWQSDNAAIFIVSGNQAIVTRGNQDVTVKITGTFSLGGTSHTADFNIVVKAQESLGSVTVDFTVTLPVGTPMSDDIFIAGNFGLGSNMPEWAPDNVAGKATRIDETTATFSITYQDLTQPVTIEYKWTRGSWDSVEKDINGDEIGNRTEVITADFPTISIDNVVERWADINPDLSDAEKIAQAKDALTAPTDVLADFTLTVAGMHGSTISWVSSDAAITINGANATITRAEADVVVTLTATISIGSLTETKTFDVTVKSLDTQLYSSFELTINVILPSNTPESDDIFIFGNFPASTGLSEWGGADNPLNKFTRDGNTATITIQFSDLTENFTLKYKITRGDWDSVEGNSEGQFLDDREYVITRLLETHEIEITVLTWEDLGIPAESDEVKVEQALNALNLATEVIEGFTLPLTGMHSTNISWASSDAAITIDGATAAVNRGELDVTVTLTASITLGEFTDTRVFEVVVKSLDTIYHDTFELTLVVTLPENTPESDEIFIFGNFPTSTGLSAWGGADNPLNKFIRDGNTATITITFTDLTENFLLEFKITRGSWDEVEGNEEALFRPNREYLVTRLLETHSVEITVLSWEDLGLPLDTEAALSAARDALTIQTDVLEDFTLPILGLHEAVIDWESSDPAITIDGAEASITRGEENQIITLTATLTLGEFTLTKDFEVTVLALEVTYFDTFELTITVEFPEYTPETDEIFIFGNFPASTGLSAWGGADNPLNKFTRDGNSATITITFTNLTENFLVEFKITRGSWDKVEGNEEGFFRPNREYVITRLVASAELTIDVPMWEDLRPPLSAQEQLDEAHMALVIPTTYSEDFTLPLLGLNDVIISWVSSDDAITIDGASATIIRGLDDTPVLLTATLTLGDLSLEKDFEVTVLADGTIQAPDFVLTIHVTIPSYTPENDEIFIFGNFPASTGLDAWGGAENPLNKLTREGNTATITVNFYDLEPNFTLQYKITRGDWARVEGDVNAQYRPNREYIITGALELHSISITVLSWEDIKDFNADPTVVGNLTVINDFLMPEYGEEITRTIRIWTPLGYDPNGTTTYPVIYMQDGQNLFDLYTSFAGEWEIDETITRLMLENDFPGAIVVGIDNAGAGRLNEYTPNWSDTPSAGGALYAQFIVDTLKPYIDQNYLTKPEREHTMIAGSSMGGLISFYIGLSYPEVFGMVGAFSTSFQINTQAARNEFITSLDTTEPLPRLILDAGSLESLDTYVPIVVQELSDAGYPMDNVFAQVVDGQGHNESAWRLRFADSVLWLFSQATGNYVPTT